MTQDEEIKILKEKHDKLQEGLPPTKMAIREGIVVDVGESDYPKFGFEFFCWRSPEMTREMTAFIKYAEGKKCLFDIGSFHGIFSLVFSKLNKSSIVHAFEPFGEPFSILEKTAIANNGNIQIAHAALSDRTGKLQLYSWGGHLEGHKREEKQEPVYVSSITGDAYCFGIVPNIAPDFLKIDCEGSELKVLLGLNNVIYKHRPTILLELHSDQISKEEAIEISKFIGWYNYKVVSVETGNEMPLSNILEQKGELRVLLI